MRIVWVRFRLLIGVLAVAMAAGLLTPVTAQAATEVTATENVNVRAKPSSTATIVGGLYRGETVTALSTADGWTAISYEDSSAYVLAKYLSAGADLPPSGQVDPGVSKVTTADVNLRKGPGLTYDVISVIPDGTAVTLTGKTAVGWSELTYSGDKGWVSTQYLADVSTGGGDPGGGDTGGGNTGGGNTGGGSGTGGLPTITGTRLVLERAAIRTKSGDNGKVIAHVDKGTTLSVTGATQNGRVQIIWKDAVRWVTAKHLANPDSNEPAPPPPTTLPPVTGTRFATAVLNIRSTAEDDYTLLAEVPVGTVLSITGVTQNARAQIVWDNAIAWVTAQYLSTTPPSGTGTSPDPYAVEKGLQPNAIKVHRAAMAKFPQIVTYYGVRKDPLPDHPSGRALDLMIPDYKSAAGKKLGKEVADWARANASELGINYVIWDQHIWNELRANEGWRYMAGRGSDTANHKNHVHITVLAKGYKPI